MKQELLTVVRAYFPDILQLNGDSEGFRGLAALLMGMHTRAQETRQLYL